MEYCAAIWEPYTKTTTKQIEMVQKRAACLATLVLHRYHQTSSVNAMSDQLAWETSSTFSFTLCLERPLDTKSRIINKVPVIIQEARCDFV